MDEFDRRIARSLQANARMSNVELAAAVGLSPSACLRRVRLLEHAGVIRGYKAIVSEHADSGSDVVIVQITLERQTEDYLRRFEAAVKQCPDVLECYLMSGSSDYLLRVEVQNTSDYERIHTEQLSRLPGVARIQSNFAIRRVISAAMS